MCLNIPDFNVNSLILPEVCRLQHLKRLSYPGNVPEENFEFASVLLPLLALYMGKKSIGVRAIVLWNNHRNRLHTYEHQDDIDDLDSDERGNDPAYPVDENVLPQ